MMTTNASKSFNDVLKGTLTLPIQALIAIIFFYLVKFFRRRQREMVQTVDTE